MSDDNLDGGNASPPTTILYTKKRTRTAASSARRRANKGLIQAAANGGGGNCEDDGKDQHSWFARKSAGWTDNEIKEHLTTGGTSKGGKSFSMIGDVILGDGGGGSNILSGGGGIGGLKTKPTGEDINNRLDRILLKKKYNAIVYS